MVRDGYKCVYCGTKSGRFTIDHVKPKALGGKSEFENCVCACYECNNKKGDKTCIEAEMFPKTKLIAPTISEFLMMKIKSLGIKDILAEVFNDIG